MTYIEFMGEVKGLGELGLSVYGEKADIKPLLGEGIIGDFKAIVAWAYGWCFEDCSVATVADCENCAATKSLWLSFTMSQYTLHGVRLDCLDEDGFAWQRTKAEPQGCKAVAKLGSGEAKLQLRWAKLPLQSYLR